MNSTIRALLNGFLVLILAVGMTACGSDTIDEGPADTGVGDDTGTSVDLPDPIRPDADITPDMGTEEDWGLFDFGNPPDVDAGPTFLSITAVLPSRGTVDGGTPVVVEGTGFSEDTIVFFGANPAELELVDGRLVGQTPGASAPGPVVIKVFEPAFEEPAILADGYTYVATLAVDSVFPNQVPTIGGVELTVSGRGFDAFTRISLGGITCTRHEVVSATLMRVLAPARDTPGVVDLRATNRDSTVVLDDAITYFAPLSLNHIRPASGDVAGGINVELTGTGFEASMDVEFDGILATVVSVDPTGSIAEVTIPAHAAGLVDVALRTDIDAIVEIDAFYYAAPGTLTAARITPNQGVAAGGTEVTIVGSGLDSASLSVEFDGIPATILEQGPGHVIVLAPAHGAGQVDVSVTDGITVSTVTDGFEYVDNIWIDRVTPNSGSTDGGYAVVIEGQGFTGATRVLFGNVPAVFTVDDAMTITATAPSRAAGLVDVTVERGGVSATFVDAFTFTEPLEVFGLIPARGSMAGNTYVTVFGRGFVGNVEVNFDGIAALSVEVLDPQTLAVRTPPHPSGPAVVEVSNSVETTTAPEPYTYFNPGARFGGAWGPPINGAVNVTVFEMGGAPIENAFVMLSTNAATPYQGYTDVNGMVTLSGPDVIGEQTITAIAAGYSSASVQKVNAENVTIFLTPPPEPNMGEPPPPVAATFTGKVTGLDKLAEVGPFKSTIAIVQTTQVNRSTPNPDPGGANIVRVNGDYVLNSRVGDLAVIALGGVVDDLTGEFTPVAMGVARYQVAADGQTYNVDIDLNIQLTNTITFKLDQPPLGVPNGPTINSITPWLDFGFEGVFGGLPAAEGTTDLISSSSMPALGGDLQGASVLAVGGSLSPAGGASSNAIKRNITSYAQTVYMPPLLGVPVLLSPQSGNFPVDNLFQFSLAGSTNPPDFIYAIIVDFNFTPVWDVFLPGDARSFRLPDFPDFSTLPPEEQPTPYPSGQYILQIISISSPGFDYNSVSYADLSLDGWSAYSLNGFLIFL